MFSQHVPPSWLSLASNRTLFFSLQLRQFLSSVLALFSDAADNIGRKNSQLKGSTNMHLGASLWRETTQVENAYVMTAPYHSYYKIKCKNSKISKKSRFFKFDFLISVVWRSHYICILYLRVLRHIDWHRSVCTPFQFTVVEWCNVHSWIYAVKLSHIYVPI